MATQELQANSTNSAIIITANNVVANYRTPYPQILDSFVTERSYLHAFGLRANGSVVININSSTHGGAGVRTFTDKIEYIGRFTVECRGQSVTFSIEGRDLIEPYEFIPSNSSEITAFIAAVNAASGSNDVTLTITDDVDDIRQDFSLPNRRVLANRQINYTAVDSAPGNLISRLFSGNLTRYISIVAFRDNASVILGLDDDNVSSDTTQGEDLTTYFENNGWVRFSIGSNFVDVDFSSQSDKSEQYGFTGIGNDFYRQISGDTSNPLKVTFAYSQAALSPPFDGDVELSQSYDAATASITPTLQKIGRDISLTQVYQAASASISVQREGGEVVVRQKICSTSRTGASAYSFANTARINSAFAGSLERYIRAFSIIANRIASLDLSDRRMVITRSRG